MGMVWPELTGARDGRMGDDSWVTRHNRFVFLTRGGRLVVASLAVMPAFGSESYLAPWPAPEVWHHEGLTRDAAEAAGFSRAAGGEIAFHATYIDHYLVNPLWRLRGGLARVRAARAIRDDLATLHFDDLPTPEAVTAAWQRYLGGTVAALLWAENAWRQGRPGAGAGADAVASARQVIGLGLHAVQDFASHSTWINHPDRRTATWREWSAAGGEIADLTTGAVESQGSVRHGDLGLRRAGWHPAAVPLRWGIATPAWLTAHSPGISTPAGRRRSACWAAVMRWWVTSPAMRPSLRR